MLYWLKQVWTPDIVLYNSAGDGEQGREMRTLIQVRACLLIAAVRILVVRHFFWDILIAHT